MFALLARFELNDDEAASRFDQLVEGTCDSIEAQEPGTWVYAVNDVESAPLSRVFVEIYESRDAFDEHEKMEYVQKFLTERERYVRSIHVQWLTPRRIACADEQFSRKLKRQQPRTTV